VAFCFPYCHQDGQIDMSCIVEEMLALLCSKHSEDIGEKMAAKAIITVNAESMSSQ
jgi:hypothetical protein